MAWVQRVIRSKTMIFALLLAIMGVIQASVGVFSAYMTPEAFGWFSMGVGVIVAVLRVLTTMPLQDK